MDGTLNGTSKASIGATGLQVDGSGVTQPVSGTLTVTQSTAANLKVDLSGTAANTIAIKVDGSAVTQPISAASLPLPSGAATSSNQTNGTQQTQIVQGGNTAVVDATGDLQVDVNNPVQVAPASLIISATAATGVAVTATLPAVASQFHYITLIEIVKYFTATNAASATPLIVTTTNLPGSFALTFGQPVGVIGVTDRMIHAPNSPIKSSVSNTNTTIVCPATTGIIWRVNVYYFSAT